MPKDAEWLECHWVMADLAISLHDRAAAIRLAADLAPMRCCGRWTGWAAPCSVWWLSSLAYDLVLLIECVHDLLRPVEALRHARAAVRAGGTVLVVDERAAESFTAPGGEIERFFAAASAIWCLPQGRAPTRSRSGLSSARQPCSTSPGGRDTPTGRSCRLSIRSGGSTGWSRDPARWPRRDRYRHIYRAWPALRGGAGRRGRPRRPRLPPASGRP